ncbi:hypothetical protein Gogos_021920 [Gossypium gossypioides]|uniref:NIF system FeS cluster assembly NifU N-terminal domain-containing protein n=1 Tax=Gossypium gossypioides TaxID=34282 RepID=A0A7J9D5Z9_GOSGO|nr:hypothetical protein [Gossypium gossypioides]
MAKMLRLTSKQLLRLTSKEIPSQPVQIFPRLYHKNVIDQYNNPRNVGSFKKNDPNVGTGLVGAPTCGDVMKLQIKIDEESRKIIDSCFKKFGCGSTITKTQIELLSYSLPSNLSPSSLSRSTTPCCY